MKPKRMVNEKDKRKLKEDLIQKYLNSKDKEKKLLLAIIKNKYPDFKE